MQELRWKMEGEAGSARAGWLYTAHGRVPTPTFMPVGTTGTVKAMTTDMVQATGAGIILGNTYHLMLRPGAERIRHLGGLHKFMNWPHPILTDSGGFQIMSLGPLCKLDTDGVTFKSHIDGTSHRLTPERSTDIQYALDATITMCLDECPALPAPVERIRESMRRSVMWAERCKTAFIPRNGYGQFGIVQGGTEIELRQESVQSLLRIGFTGYAIGGLAVGEGQSKMFYILDHTIPLLPDNKARYLMGVGTPDDILGCIQRGVDMFDCVMPTRAGRTGRAYTSRGVLNLRNAKHADDPRPLAPDIDNPVLLRYSRAYFHHLFRSNEILGAILLSWHNLTYYQQLVRGIRQAIVEKRLDIYANELRENWKRGDWQPEELPLS